MHRFFKSCHNTMLLYDSPWLKAALRYYWDSLLLAFNHHDKLFLRCTTCGGMGTFLNRTQSLGGKALHSTCYIWNIVRKWYYYNHMYSWEHMVSCMWPQCSSPTRQCLEPMVCRNILSCRDTGPVWHSGCHTLPLQGTHLWIHQKGKD